jgi:S1-C subfamily serine protease
MFVQPILSLTALVLLYPAPREPEPDDRGRGFFGVQLLDNAGVLITRVEPGSPADKAGIQANDVIQSIDAVDVNVVDDARETIGRLRPGTVTRVALKRGNATITIKVKVGVRPDTLP